MHVEQRSARDTMPNKIKFNANYSLGTPIINLIVSKYEVATIMSFSIAQSTKQGSVDVSFIHDQTQNTIPKGTVVLCTHSPSPTGSPFLISVSPPVWEIFDFIRKGDAAIRNVS